MSIVLKFCVMSEFLVHRLKTMLFVFAFGFFVCLFLSKE